MIQSRAIVGSGLAAQGPRGPIFTGVDIDVAEGGVATVVGPGGSGRTSLLLALAGRFPLTADHLVVGGFPLPDSASEVRRVVSVARARPAIELDETLRVRELIDERSAIEGVDAVPVVGEAMDLLGVAASPEQLVDELTPADQTLFSLALALAGTPRAVIVDDIDLGATPDELDRIWHALFDLASSGTTLIVSSTSAPPSELLDPDIDAVVDLTPAFSRTAKNKVPGPSMSLSVDSEETSERTSPESSLETSLDGPRHVAEPRDGDPTDPGDDETRVIR